MLPEDQLGDRLDHFLMSKGFCLSRSVATKWIKDGFVQINSKKVIKPSYKVEEGDQINIQEPPTKSSELIPHKVDFEILYEDEDLLVINKPAGLVVHPGAGNYETSLVHGLLHHCKDLSGIGGVERPGIVHRLDKGTSGLMVVAKNDKTHNALSQQFQEHTVQKQYLALCLGRIEKEEFTLKNLVKRAEINRKKFVVNEKKGKEAISHFKVLTKTGKVSLVQVKIDTGRTHQIRVHCNYIGHPILGDDLYGGTKKLKGLNDDDRKYVQNLGRPLLHSFQLSFVHPTTNERLEFCCDVDNDFSLALNHFNLNKLAEN